MAIKVLNEFLPTAEQVRLGGVKVGDTLSIEDGVLNTNAENTGVGGNRLTHIPRLFNLTFSNGTLTLHAGGKIYLPDGFESDETTPKFTEYTITENQTRTLSGSADGKYTLLFEPNGIGIRVRPVANCYSGSIAPSTAGSWAWYDTANNLIKIYDDTTLVNSMNSLPIGQITVSGGVISKINSIMAETGYLGNIVFALPGIHGTIPYGFQPNTLNPQSLNFETNKVLVAQAPGVPNTNYNLYLNENALSISNDIFYDGNSNLNRQISNTSNIIFSAKTSAKIYCDNSGGITWFSRAFVEASAYDDCYEQTMPWSFTAYSYLNANKGYSLVGQINPASGAFVPFLRHKSNTGVFLVDGHQDHLEVVWTSDSTIAANTNNVTHRVTLLNEAGNASFPGDVSAVGTIEATASTAL